MEQDTRRRIVLLDEIRGVMIFCMIFYHAFYNLAFLLDLDAGYWLWAFFTPVEPLFAGLFILLSGMNCNLSHNNWLRGIKLMGIALAISVITILFVKNEAIYFGILHLLSVSMVLYGLLQKWLARWPVWPLTALWLVLFWFTYHMEDRWLGFLGLRIHLPDAWYQNPYLFPFGIATDTFFSSDYFPIFPWIFLFFAGAFFGRWFFQRKLPEFWYRRHVGFFAVMGKYALWIYVLHQPVLYAVTALLEML